MSVTVTQADREAALAILGTQELQYRKDGTFRCWDDVTQAFAFRAEQAKRETEELIVAWLRQYLIEDRGWTKAIATAIEQGAYKQ